MYVSYIHKIFIQNRLKLAFINTITTVRLLKPSEMPSRFVSKSKLCRVPNKFPMYFPTVKSTNRNKLASQFITESNSTKMLKFTRYFKTCLLASVSKHLSRIRIDSDKLVGNQNILLQRPICVHCAPGSSCV